MLLLLPGMAAAQPANLPCDVQAQAKSGNLYRIATPTRLYVNCDNTSLEQFSTTGNLYLLSTDSKAVSGPAAPVTVKLHPDKKGRPTPWLAITLSGAGGGRLEGGKSYRLVLAEEGKAAVKVAGQPEATGPFKPLALDISTTPAARIAPSFLGRDKGAGFLVSSNVALCGVEGAAIQFHEIGLLGQKIYHNAEAIPFRDSDAPRCVSNGNYGDMPNPDTPDSYGRATVKLKVDQLRQSSATIEITGIHDIFGQDLALKNDVSLGGVPKTKDDAFWYMKFNHQAGPGSLPGWVVDAKLAPQVGHPVLGGFFWKPALNMDIGGGVVSQVKENDTITASLGLTRLYRTETRGLEAFRFTPAVTFETNREFNQRNLISDVDVAFDFTGLTAPRARRSWEIYNKSKDPDKKYSSELAAGGAGIQFFLGSEVGHSMDAQTVNAANSSAAVRVAPYSVARIRSKATAFAEYKRLSLSLTATCRYLFTTEIATRQSVDQKSIRLDPISGFRPYGEAGIRFTLDPSGHIAFNTTYKLGSEPPSFIYANTVQSGLLFVY